MVRPRYKFHNAFGIPGCIRRHQNFATGTWIRVCCAPQSGFSVRGGYWAVYCEDHDIVCNVPTLAKAKALAGHPLDWCPKCIESIM